MSEYTKYALNVNKGSTINHPTIGKLVGGVAMPVTDREAGMVKNIINVVIFESVSKRD
jgi:hypothetical protein